MRSRILSVLAAGWILAGLATFEPLYAQGTFNFVSRAGQFARPVGVLGLLFTPREGQGGQSVKLTIALTAPAPAGGYVVPLYSSDHKLLPVPKSIRVPAGMSRLQVTITAPAVKTITSLIISTTETGATRKPAKDGPRAPKALLTIHP